MEAGSVTREEERPNEEELPKMSLLDHLDELRRRLGFSAIAIFVAFLGCWYFAKPIFEVIEQPLTQFLPKGDKLAFTGLVDPFMLYIKVALLAGIFLASPVVLWQLWLFVSPGLYRRERRMVLPFIFFTTLFFVTGGFFGWKVAFPMVCRFLLQVGSDFRQVITVNEYFSMASKTILGLGLVFELPIMMLFLARIGVVTHKFLLRQFRYAVLLIFVVAAIITPTPDIATQSVFAVPMIALYLLGVLVAWLFGKKPEPAEE
jgi:sec-independent protein translocase protein TatC